MESLASLKYEHPAQMSSTYIPSSYRRICDEEPIHTAISVQGQLEFPLLDSTQNLAIRLIYAYFIPSEHRLDSTSQPLLGLLRFSYLSLCMVAFYIH